MAVLEVVNQSILPPSALEEAISLYASNWGEIMRAELHISSDSELRKILIGQQMIRTDIFPQGQRAVIDKQTGLPFGTINSLLYHSNDLPSVISWNQLTSEGYHTNHEDDGDSLICVAIQTSARGAARLLVESQAELAKRLGKRLFVFTRPNGFEKYLQQHPGTTIEQYLNLLTKDGIVIKDDGVSFHKHMGATLSQRLKDNKPYLPNSRPGDRSSMFYNVLMEYRP